MESPGITEEMKFLAGAEHEVHPADRCNFFRLKLSVASENNEEGIGRSAKSPPYELAAFTVSPFCNAAGVENTNIGMLAERNDPVSAVGELLFEAGRFGVIELAS